MQPIDVCALVTCFIIVGLSLWSSFIDARNHKKINAIIGLLNARAEQDNTGPTQSENPDDYENRLDGLVHTVTPYKSRKTTKYGRLCVYDPAPISARLKHLNDYRYTDAAIADWCGMNPCTLRQVANGRSDRAGIVTLQKIAKGLDIPIESIIKDGNTC